MMNKNTLTDVLVVLGMIFVLSVIRLGPFLLSAVLSGIVAAAVVILVNRERTR